MHPALQRILKKSKDHTLNNEEKQPSNLRSRTISETKARVKHQSEIDNSSTIFLQNRNNLLSFERHDRLTGKKLTALIDIQTCNNYISKKDVKHIHPVRLSEPFQIETKRGKVDITHFVRVKLFTHWLRCFIIEDLGGFDFILGMDGLRKINARIDLKSFVLKYRDDDKKIHRNLPSKIPLRVKMKQVEKK